jgi:hypothetical protein
MVDFLSLGFWKIFKKSGDDSRTRIENERMNDGFIIPEEKKSKNELIREEFLNKRSLSKRIQNWQNIRKYSFLNVKKR